LNYQTPLLKRGSPNHGANGMDNLLQYAKSLGDNAEIIAWLTTAGKKAIVKGKIKESDLEHIVDWLYSSDAPKRLQRMSVIDAIRLTAKWMENNKRKGKDLSDSKKDIKTFMKFKDDSKIVKLLTENAFKREGFLMSHCLGGYSVRKEYDIYSLRDKNNNPHATFEVSIKDKDILQIKGKGNGPIHPKYIHRVLDFLKKVGMDIRPSEMKNLGYYHIDPFHLDFVKHTFKNEKLIKLGNEHYVV
jgi:hypothetical protein